MLSIVGMRPSQSTFLVVLVLCFAGESVEVERFECDDCTLGAVYKTALGSEVGLKDYAHAFF